jgi:hypothetical protein
VHGRMDTFSLLTSSRMLVARLVRQFLPEVSGRGPVKVSDRQRTDKVRLGFYSLETAFHLDHTRLVTSIKNSGPRSGPDTGSHTDPRGVSSKTSNVVAMAFLRSPTPYGARGLS